MVTGIGGGLGAANIMGMFGQQNTAQAPQYTAQSTIPGPIQGFVGSNYYQQG
jgi:hypothetical protein